MGVFDDKKFEQLDWMSQITETIESEINGLLARLPDRFELDISYIRKYAAYTQFSISSDSVVQDLIRNQSVLTSLEYGEMSAMAKCFRLEMSPNFEINFETDVITGSLALVKVIPTLTDEELQPLMGMKGIEAVRRINYDTEDKTILGRMNEMLDVLGKSEDAILTRSFKKKSNQIILRLREIFSTNEWRIRDMQLANKIGKWIADYISTGNLAALTNFCKLKVMTHNNMPIYSVEEEK